MPRDFALGGVVLATIAEDDGAGGLRGGFAGKAFRLEEGPAVEGDVVGKLGAGLEAGKFGGIDVVFGDGGGCDLLLDGGDGFAFGAGDGEFSRGGGVEDDGEAGGVGGIVAELEVRFDKKGGSGCRRA